MQVMKYFSMLAFQIQWNFKIEFVANRFYSSSIRTELNARNINWVEKYVHFIQKNILYNLYCDLYNRIHSLTYFRDIRCDDYLQISRILIFIAKHQFQNCTSRRELRSFRPIISPKPGLPTKAKTPNSLPHRKEGKIMGNNLLVSKW